MSRQHLINFKWVKKISTYNINIFFSTLYFRLRQRRVHWTGYVCLRGRLAGKGLQLKYVTCLWCHVRKCMMVWVHRQ